MNVLRSTLFSVFIPALLFVLAPDSVSQIRFFDRSETIPDAQSVTLLSASPGRSVLSLDGRWRYRVGEQDEWKTVLIPSSFEGIAAVTFKRDFTVNRDLLRKSVFQFVALSISYYCEISINGQFIGKHAGESSFSFKVSPGIIKPGKNTISISVNNILNSRETVPLREQLWKEKNFGGILHAVALVANSGVWVQESYIRSEINKSSRSATLYYQAFLNSGEISKLPGDTAAPASEFGRSFVDHSFEILDAETGVSLAASEIKRVTIESDRLISVELKLTIPEARLWTPEAPVLYRLRRKTMRGGVLVSQTESLIGLRSIESSGEGLILNGKQVFLKTVAYVEDSPRYGRSMSADEIERDILLIKNLGANAIRFTGGSVHPYLLDLCDRYGLLVLMDIPINNVPSALLLSDGIRSSALNIFREIMARDFNHPSLVAWGFASGVISRPPSAKTFFEMLSSSMKQHSGHLRYASFMLPPLPNEIEELDFIALDIFPHTASTVQHLLEEFATLKYDKPVMIGALSYPVEIGNYNGYSNPRSIDAQAQFYLEAYNYIRSNKFSGLVISSFADRGATIPIMSVDRVQQYTATCGIVDRYRQKRIAYDVLKTRFNDEKPPVLVSGDYEAEQPVSFVIIGILLIFIFAVVYNVFRRFRENVVRSLMRPFNFFADVRDQRMLSIFQTTIIGFIGSTSLALIIANMMYFWRMNFFFDAILTQFVHCIPLKQWLNYAAWNPLENILVLTAVFFLALLFFTLLLRMGSLMFKKKIFLFDAYSVSMWSMLPAIMFAPFGMVLYRLMGLPVFEVLAVVVLVSIVIWIISRLMKGGAVVYDIRPLFFYLFGYTAIVLALGAWLVMLNNEYGIFSYLKYYSDLWWFLGAFTT